VLKKQLGTQSRTLFLEKTVSLPYKVETSKAWTRPLRIGIVQIITPDSNDYKDHKEDPKLDNDKVFRQKHRAHLAAALEGVNQMSRVRETHRRSPRDDGQIIDLLVLPELAVHPDDVQPLLVPFARKHRCILLFGMVYHSGPMIAGSPTLINSCQWLIPEWRQSTGFHLHVVEQGKKHLNKDEMELSPPLVGFRPAQWLIEYEWNSDREKHRPLRISATICYDATDLALAADLKARSDLFIICALNQDVGTFDRMTEGLHYHMFQGVLLVNNGQFGGSSFFMPFQKPFNRQVFHLHGQPQVSIAFAEIDPLKLINRPNNMGKYPEGEWKTPPANWSNHSPKE